MEILHIIASANLAEGGPIEHAVKAGEALARRGHRQDFLTIDAAGSPAIADTGATVHAMGHPSGLRPGILGKARSVLLDAPRAASWLKSNAKNYDVAIVSGLWNVSTLAARLGLVAGELPYVLFTHGMLDPYFNRAYPWKGRAKQLLWFVNEGVLVRNAARVLFTCEEEKRLARESFKPYRANETVIAFGTADAVGEPDSQIEQFRSSMPELGDRPFLLFLSRIHEKKGIDLLIEAFAAVAADHPELDLVIAGPDTHGMKPALTSRAQTLGISARIHWPGMLKDDLKWGAFRACEAFVLPSHQENFGIVVAEALACNRPVLISDKVNIWREIAEDGAGIVTTDSVAGATELLTRFLALSSEEREAMNHQARQCFANRFDMESAITDLENTLNEVILEASRTDSNGSV